MHSPDSKIADLLPRIVERPARRSDEKEEEPWVKPQPACRASESTAGPLPAGASFVLLMFAIFPSVLAFLATGLVGRESYWLSGAAAGLRLHCTGAPLVHTITIDQFGTLRQFFAGALLVNGLMWVAVAAAVWWSLHEGSRAWLACWEGGVRRFSIGQLLAVSVGVAMVFSAWRWDLAVDVPWVSTAEATEKAFESGEPAGPQFQPIFRFSVVAASYAYLGVGCAAFCLVSGGLWLIRQFLPRRPGEDKSLLQQIF